MGPSQRTPPAEGCVDVSAKWRRGSLFALCLRTLALGHQLAHFGGRPPAVLRCRDAYEVTPSPSRRSTPTFPSFGNSCQMVFRRKFVKLSDTNLRFLSKT